MQNLLKPRWLLLVNTLPLALLFFLFGGTYQIIKTLLTEENIRLLAYFGAALAIMGLLNLGYTLLLIRRGKQVSATYGAFALLCYIPFLYAYAFFADQIIPADIPRWMMPGNLMLYVGTFLMPTLAYALFILVLRFTPEARAHTAWKNFLIAMLVPVSWYLFFQVVFPLWKPVEQGFGMHALLVFFIAGTLVFLFFISRSVYILATKKAGVWQRYPLIWKMPIALVFPLLGLAVNHGFLIDGWRIGDQGVFGDFSSPWFNILALANGFLICLPELQYKTYRLLLFIGRSICFSYTLYFFLVFLPFLPLSILAIIVFGAGFLMLTPLVLLVLHAVTLTKDEQFLSRFFPKSRIRMIFVLGLLLIPGLISGIFIHHKKVLHEALDYLYSPDYSRAYQLDRSSVLQTIRQVNRHKAKNDDFLLGNQTPYLSAYFNWLVFGNLTLPDSKINLLEKVFAGGASFEVSSPVLYGDDVRINQIGVKSTYDSTTQSWRSWVDLELSNESGRALATYASMLDLPEGCWISDYYLYVGERREAGILAEKKTAMWVFSQIRNENRDPGILYYLSGNRVAFQVFPFAKDEKRKTGIEFIHREPVQLTLDDKMVELGRQGQTETSIFENDQLIYIPAREKEKLRRVYRRPYFHFLIDASAGKAENAEAFTRRIQSLQATQQEEFGAPRFSLVNTYVQTLPQAADLEKALAEQKFEGGFYLDRAVRTILFQAHQEPADRYPVLVVVSDSLYDAVWNKDFSDFKTAYPESDLFFHLREDGRLRPHSLSWNPWEPLADTLPYSFRNAVLEYRYDNGKTAYLADNGQAGMLLKKAPLEPSERALVEKNWTSALQLHGLWLSQLLHPERGDEEWLPLVRQSFQSKIMSPVTAYLVVENEAQKAILRKKQAQVLSGNPSLDPGEDAQRMSEPGFWWMAMLLALLGWFKRRSWF